MQWQTSYWECQCSLSLLTKMHTHPALWNGAQPSLMSELRTSLHSRIRPRPWSHRVPWELCLKLSERRSERPYVQAVNFLSWEELGRGQWTLQMTGKDSSNEWGRWWVALFCSGNLQPLEKSNLFVFRDSDVKLCSSHNLVIITCINLQFWSHYSAFGRKYNLNRCAYIPGVRLEYISL